jgi:hypothetical protein
VFVAGILVTTLDIFKSFYTRDEGRNESDPKTQHEGGSNARRITRAVDRRMSGTVEWRVPRKAESAFHIITYANSSKD